MQADGYLKLVLARDGNDLQTTMVHLPSSGKKSQQASSIRQALHLDLNQKSFPLYNRSWSGDRNEISIKGRSLLGTLQFLSRYVGQPDEHTKRGLADKSKDQATVLAGDLLNVSVSKTKPTHAFTTINYRDHWFYIADNDKRSKSTFGLLSQLLSLQAKESAQSNSFLTIPVN